MPQYRVIDLISGVIDPEAIVVEAKSPEHAAEVALGVSLTRSGTKKNLRARVYFQHSNTGMNLVRLYTRVANAVPP